MIKRRRKNKNKIDWVIHVIQDAYEGNDLLAGMMNFHTHGLEKYGLTNISAIVMTSIYDANEVGRRLNTIARMMVKNPNEFDVRITHYIDKEDDSTDFKFRMLPTVCFGEKTIRIIFPDKNNHFLGEVKELSPLQFQMQYSSVPETMETGH